MSVYTAEDVLSGIEPLPMSSPPSPSFAPPPPAVLPLSSASLPSLTRSWPSSPLSASRQVTAHLYSSLQRSKDQEVKGYSAITALTSGDLSAKARQVAFKIPSPELCTITMPTATSSLLSDRLNESEEVGFSLDASSSHCIVDRVEAESETEQMTGNMDLNLQSRSGRRHIEEMQNVRSHLQTILNTARTTEETDEFMEPVSHHIQDDLNESDTTSHLLSAALSLGGVEDLFPRYSRLRADVNPTSFPSFSELHVTRESLERERARRKHSEQQVLALQTKALTLQQQLALAVSAHRKKDIMIEQLDKTLEKVVEGWRRQEQEKSERLQHLQEEKEAADREQDRQREALVCFEKSLSEAAETLDKEQKCNEKLKNTNTQLEQELAELRVCVEELQQQGQKQRAEAEEQRAEAGRLQIHTQDLQAQLEQQSLLAKQTQTQLQQDVTLLTQQLERERERVSEEMQLREEVQSTLQQLQQELNDTRRERDAARVDRALDQARFEAQCSQREVEVRLTVEQQVTDRLAHIQQEHDAATAKLREQHRKQLLELRDHHERERSVQMEESRAQLQVQLQERDARQQQLTLHYTSRMAELQEQLVSMETSKRRLETQREELVSRLQGMMRSHWTEALRLLTNPEQAEGEFPSVSLYGTARPPSCPETEYTSSFGTETTATPAVPQAVVLHLSRERQCGVLEEWKGGADAGTTHSHLGVLNHSLSFSALEPVLDDTHLTGGAGLSTLWDKPLEGLMPNRGREGEQEQMERKREKEEANPNPNPKPRSTTERPCAESDPPTLSSKPVHYENQDSYSYVNQIRTQVEHTGVNRQVNHNPVPSFSLNPLHSSERQISQTRILEKEVGKYDRCVQKHSTTEGKAPPIKEQNVSIKERGLTAVSSVSSLDEDRQTELQYYISKLLDRSPGEPLNQQPSDRRSDTHSLSPGVSSDWECVPVVREEALHTQTLHTHNPVDKPSHPSCPPPQLQPQLEQLTSLLHLATPSTHTKQQLHQLLSGLLRSGEPSADAVTANLDHKLTQHEKKERQAPSRATQSTAIRRHRSGPQVQRSGSKVNAWR